MTALFHAAMADLFGQIQALSAPGSASTGAGARVASGGVAPGRQHVLDSLGRGMARAWLRQQPMPSSVEDLTDLVLAQPPAWGCRLTAVFRCRQAMGAMTDAEFCWRPTGRQSDGDLVAGGSWPQERQLVLYFFDVVGPHPGYYAGMEDGLDHFCGLFGGFLGGDVTHWMPMPGLEDEILPRAAVA